MLDRRLESNSGEVCENREAVPVDFAEMPEDIPSVDRAELFRKVGFIKSTCFKLVELDLDLEPLHFHFMILPSTSQM